MSRMGSDRSSSMPRSVLRLKVDKVQGLRSGILVLRVHTACYCILDLLSVNLFCRDELSLGSDSYTNGACLGYNLGPKILHQIADIFVQKMLFWPFAPAVPKKPLAVENFLRRYFLAKISTFSIYIFLR